MGNEIETQTYHFFHFLSFLTFDGISTLLTNCYVDTNINLCSVVDLALSGTRSSSQEHSSAIFGTRSLSRTNNTKWCRAYSFLDPIDLGICLLSPNFVVSSLM